MSEARDLDHSHVGTEHLLLGLLREEVGVAAKSLHASGVTEEAARATVLRLMGLSPANAAGKTAGPASRLESVAIEVKWKDGGASRHEFATVREAIHFLETGRFLGRS